MVEKIETLIVGGGQGGLSTSYHLKQASLEHVILEKSEQAASAWRNRWDSFTLITPNWMTQLPGSEYQGDAPEGFTTREEVISYFEDYIEQNKLPIRYGVKATSVQPEESKYRVTTDQGEFIADNVVIATGMYQQPNIPEFNANLSSEIVQLHSSEYRNPDSLPAGSVLVVGSAQSGCQIAEELYQSGRKVYLSVSNAGRAPRRYRGKDITLWFDELGGYNRTVDNLPSPKAKFGGSLHGTGKDGGHTINLHQFSRDGVVLLGHVQSCQDHRISLSPDLKDNLTKTDKGEAEIVKQIDEYIMKSELDAPEETLPELRDGYESDEILDLDLQASGINCVIWATGYGFDFGLVKIPVFDEDGYPVQKRGVTDHPGLYFVGLPFLHTSKSGLLYGVGDDAAHLVEHIASRIAKTT